MDSSRMTHVDDFEELSLLPAFIDQWYSNILDSINDGILVIDREAIVRYINPEYTKITGISAEHIVGKPLKEVRPSARLVQIMEAGTAVAGVYRREGDIEYVVDMAPIRIKEQIIGAVSIVKNVSEVHKLTEQLRKYASKANRLKNTIDHMYKAKYTFQSIIGDSLPLREVIRLASRIALGQSDILITGESGTGKEVFAQSIHNASNRQKGPFVAVNCAAISPTLVESELFGYEDGAFTGAKKGGKIGLFEIATGGTIFLDEIAELSLELQAKLLRVLQERTIRRVGENSEIPVDIRVIAATNKSLQTMIDEKQFRADLFYRLNVLTVHLPPLRERGSDVVLLAVEFLRLYAVWMGRSFSFDSTVLKALHDYDWPGNVRELKNVIEYVVNVSESEVIGISSLPKWFPIAQHDQQESKGSLTERVQSFERQTIRALLDHYGTDMEAKRFIAKELGISVATLYNKLKDT